MEDSVSDLRLGIAGEEGRLYALLYTIVYKKLEHCRFGYPEGNPPEIPRVTMGKVGESQKLHSEF